MSQDYTEKMKRLVENDSYAKATKGNGFEMPKLDLKKIKIHNKAIDKYDSPSK